MRCCLNGLAAAALCVLLPAVVLGQGMCVPDPVAVGRIEGVVLFEAGGDSRPLPNATVAIFPYAARNASQLASGITRDDGHFSISAAAPGRYWLSVNHEALIGFTTEVRLRPRSSPTAFLIATIRNDPNKPCGGNSIRLSPVFSETCRSLEYQNQNQIDYGPLKVRRVEGVVWDTQSTAVPQTCIGIFSEPGHTLVSSVETEEDGSFRFGSIRPGRYRLVANQQGFGVANLRLEILGWPSGGVLKVRKMVVHLRPKGIDTTSYVDRKR